MAPTIDMIQWATYVSLPVNKRPSQVPTNAPAIPSNIVMMHPPGSFPGINNFAIAPTTKPITNVQMIDEALKSIGRRV